jgi:hypothetical protein
MPGAGVSLATTVTLTVTELQALKSIATAIGAIAKSGRVQKCDAVTLNTRALQLRKIAERGLQLSLFSPEQRV